MTFAAAVPGIRFKPGGWHAALRKPTWNPPNWVFAPAWTILYVCIAVAGWLVWRAGGGAWSTTLTLWAIGLVFNALWSWIFFGQHRIGLAAINCLVMLAFIVAFMVAARASSTTAVALFVPYAAWVIFATALNTAIWRLNRAAR